MTASYYYCWLSGLNFFTPLRRASTLDELAPGRRLRNKTNWSAATATDRSAALLLVAVAIYIAVLGVVLSLSVDA